jgi:ribosome biogenesis GTPase
LLGWDDWFHERFALFAQQGYARARVIADFGAEYLVHDGEETLRAEAGRHLRNDGGQLPAVGDWVALRHREPLSTIHGWVERKTAFSRKAASIDSREQVLAANVDIAFVVASAQDVNARRIERYLTMAWQSGAAPVVVLTKSDVAGSPDELRMQLEAAAMGTPVLTTSAITGEGVGALADRLRPSRTGVLLGPSGAGKSTLINRMAGVEVMKTRTVHRSGEGRHMTSHRELFQLPGGGMIIDTPGLREAQLWTGEDALGNLFEDIEDVARSCRFSDCDHRSERRETWTRPASKATASFSASCERWPPRATRVCVPRSGGSGSRSRSTTRFASGCSGNKSVPAIFGDGMLKRAVW